jgi:heterodisulfide reductase subunit A-like polyferredoxin
VYHRGKGLITILIHPKLLFRFKHTEEREVEGLENICCVRGKCGNFDVIVTQKPEYLRSDMGTAVIHEQHSCRLRVTWINPQHSDVRDKLMANEVFKSERSTYDLALRSIRKSLPGRCTP